MELSDHDRLHKAMECFQRSSVSEWTTKSRDEFNNLILHESRDSIIHQFIEEVSNLTHGTNDSENKLASEVFRIKEIYRLTNSLYQDALSNLDELFNELTMKGEKSLKKTELLPIVWRLYLASKGAFGLFVTDDNFNALRVILYACMTIELCNYAKDSFPDKHLQVLEQNAVQFLSGLAYPLANRLPPCNSLLSDQESPLDPPIPTSRVLMDVGFLDQDKPPSTTFFPPESFIDKDFAGQVSPLDALLSLSNTANCSMLGRKNPISASSSPTNFMDTDSLNLNISLDTIFNGQSQEELNSLKEPYGPSFGKVASQNEALDVPLSSPRSMDVDSMDIIGKVAHIAGIDICELERAIDAVREYLFSISGNLEIAYGVEEKVFKACKEGIGMGILNEEYVLFTKGYEKNKKKRRISESWEELSCEKKNIKLNSFAETKSTRSDWRAEHSGSIRDSCEKVVWFNKLDQLFPAIPCGTPVDTYLNLFVEASKSSRNFKSFPTKKQYPKSHGKFFGESEEIAWAQQEKDSSIMTKSVKDATYKARALYLKVIEKLEDGESTLLYKSEPQLEILALCLEAVFNLMSIHWLPLAWTTKVLGIQTLDVILAIDDFLKMCSDMPISLQLHLKAKEDDFLEEKIWLESSCIFQLEENLKSHKLWPPPNLVIRSPHRHLRLDIEPPILGRNPHLDALEPRTVIPRRNPNLKEMQSRTVLISGNDSNLNKSKSCAILVNSCNLSEVESKTVSISGNSPNLNEKGSRKLGIPGNITDLKIPKVQNSSNYQESKCAFSFENSNISTNRKTENTCENSLFQTELEKMDALMRKVLDLALARVARLCLSKIGLSFIMADQVWTLVLCCFRHHMYLLKNRHLDQILLCAIYSVCKLNSVQSCRRKKGQKRDSNPECTHISFTDLQKKYSEIVKGNRNKANTLIFNRVQLKKAGNYGTICDFYNTCFIPALKNAILDFKHYSKQQEAVALVNTPSEAFEVSKNASNDLQRFQIDAGLEAKVWWESVAPNLCHEESKYAEKILPRSGALSSLNQELQKTSDNICSNVYFCEVDSEKSEDLRGNSRFLGGGVMFKIGEDTSKSIDLINKMMRQEG